MKTVGVAERPAERFRQRRTRGALAAARDTHEHDDERRKPVSVMGSLPLLPGSTCPPKPLRMAESTFSAKVWSWRERKRV